MPAGNFRETENLKVVNDGLTALWYMTKNLLANCNIDPSAMANYENYKLGLYKALTKFLNSTTGELGRSEIVEIANRWGCELKGNNAVKINVGTLEKALTVHNSILEKTPSMLFIDTNGSQRNFEKNQRLLNMVAQTKRANKDFKDLPTASLMEIVGDTLKTNRLIDKPNDNEQQMLLKKVSELQKNIKNYLEEYDWKSLLTVCYSMWRCFQGYFPSEGTDGRYAEYIPEKYYNQSIFKELTSSKAIKKSWTSYPKINFTSMYQIGPI